MPLRYEKPNLLAFINDVTVGRAYNVVYTNLRDRPIMVIVTSRHDTPAPAPVHAYILVNVAGNNITNSGYPTTVAMNVNHALYTNTVFMVPAGATFQVLSVIGGGGVNTLQTWIEVDL